MRPTRARRLLALVTGLIVTVPLCGQAVATAQEPQVNASTLSKNAVDITSPGHFPVEHGDVINWILSYAGNAGTGQATVTDAIQPGQSFVPGSLKVPPGWSPSWSTDGGTTFQNTEPGSGVTAIRAINPQARPGGTNLAHFLLPPVQTTATPTGGDGYTPVIYRDQNGAVEAWNTYHHLAPASPKVVCTNLLTNQPCAGGPWPRPLNTTPGPLSAGLTGDIQSTLTPQYVTDPAHPERLYYAAVTAASVGVACLDMAARANCGYYALQNGVSGIGGIVAANGNLYGVSTVGNVLCLNFASLTPCAGQPYAAIVAANNNGGYYFGSLTVAGGKVFASASPGSGPQLGCFDPVAATACTGWASPKPATGSYTYAAFTSYDTAGNANGACVPAVAGGPPPVTCYALDGSALPAPAGFSSVANGALTFNPETASLNGSLRSYFPFWGGSLAGGTGCYDWTAAAICAGFPFPKTHPNVNGGATRDYGYDYDETTQCLVGLGDAGFLFSVDPTSGTSPCIHSGASVSLSPGAFYCDEALHSQTYTKAQLENITLSNVDLANSSATIIGTGGTVLATVPFAADGSVDLSGISPAAHPTLTVNAQLTLLSTADFGGGNQPSIVISYQGDPPQVCFRTTISTACSVNEVSNTGNGSDPGGSLTSNPVTLPVSPGPGCQPIISLNKEICADTRASRCGPSGPGPWVKKSPAGLLGLLGTAYWRITVTNTGDVDAVQATLTDQVAPSCVSAAGTFTVPAHSTRQFFCSSTLLILPLTNTATASFLAAGSPPGTQPTTTPPSSAIACSLLCLLLP